MQQANLGDGPRSLPRVLLAIGLVLSIGALVVACNLRDRAHQGVAYLVGMQEYVFGFPLVIMDVTREVMTATSVSGEYKAPMNQFARLRAYVDPEFKDVVRISVKTPRDYAGALSNDPGRGAALRQGSAPRPLAGADNNGTNQPRTLVMTG